MQFKLGDIVKFTNKGSWSDDCTGLEGQIIDIVEGRVKMYVVEFGKPISQKGLTSLYVLGRELELIRRGDINEV